MSGLAGLKTKKVNTYGKRNTRIVSLYKDLTPEKLDYRESSGPAPTPSRLATARPALASKDSVDNIRHAPRRHESDPKARVNVLKPLDSLASPAIHRPSRNRRRAVIPLSPSTVGTPETVADSPPCSEYEPSSPVRQVKPRRMILDSVELPIRSRRARPHRGIREVSIELIDQLDDLAIGTSTRAPDPITPGHHLSLARHRTSAQVAEGYKQLEQACDSAKVFNFSGIFSALGYLLPKSPAGQCLTVTKAGEATYSEVFAVSHDRSAPIIIKIIPLEDVTADEQHRGDDWPELSDAGGVAKEIAVTRQLSDLGRGLIRLKAAYIAQGSYTALLLKHWDSYQKKWGSENTRPSCFGKTQKYVVLCLEDGGVDLESFAFDAKTGWVQAAGVFWQVADALARAENRAQFEHRDLHEGQILIELVDVDASPGENYIEPQECGVQATLIDFGLSRLTDATSGQAIFTPLPDNIMDGEGPQWDVYRAMRDAADGDWEAYRPETNIRWLRYIVGYILTNCPSLKTPSKPRAAVTAAKGGRGKSSEADKRCQAAYNTLVEAKAVLDAAFKDAGQVKGKKRGAGAKAAAGGGAVHLPDAQSLVEWAKGKGFIA